MHASWTDTIIWVVSIFAFFSAVCFELWLDYKAKIKKDSND